MSNLGKLFEEVGTEYFNAEAAPVSRVYVDLEYIQDLKLGAVINNITVEPEMHYIQTMLNRYNNRYDLNTAKYFPVLKYTEDMLKQELNDPKKIDRICLVAPWTSVYYHLLETIDLFTQQNKRLNDDAKQIELTINVSDVQYPIELQCLLQRTIEKLLNIKVIFTHIPRYTDESENYLQYELMFIYDYGLFVQQQAKSFVADGKFSNTRIIAHPYIQDGLGHKVDDYEYVLKSTEKGMDIYCDFLFLRSNITLTK